MSYSNIKSQKKEWLYSSLENAVLERPQRAS